MEAIQPKEDYTFLSHSYLYSRIDFVSSVTVKIYLYFWVFMRACFVYTDIINIYFLSRSTPALPTCSQFISNAYKQK